MSRGAAIQAAIEWSLEVGSGSRPGLLPRQSTAPTDMEKRWHRCVQLFAETTGTNPLLADSELRQNYIDFLSHLKVVLDLLERDCRELPYADMMPLAGLACERYGWSREEILQLVNEYHQDTCRRCSTRG